MVYFGLSFELQRDIRSHASKFLGRWCVHVCVCAWAS